MTYPKAIVIAAALIAGAQIWSAQAQNEPPRGENIRALAGGELVWWLEAGAKGPRIAVCAFDGREIECDSKLLAEVE